MKFLFVPTTVDGHKGSIGSKRLRCDWLVDEFGKDADVFSELMDISKYDVLFLQKAYIKTLDMVKNFNGLVIMDVCDPIHYDDRFKRVMEHVDIFTCSSDKLYWELSKIKPTYLLPDRINRKFLPDRKRFFKPNPKLIYFGYSNNHPINMPLPDIVVSDKHYGAGEFYKWDDITCWDNIKIGDILIYQAINDYKKSVHPTNRQLIAWSLGLVCAQNEKDFDYFKDPINRMNEVIFRNKLIDSMYLTKHSIIQLKGWAKRWLKY